MVNFKLCIADPKTGKAYQTEVKEQSAQGFMGMNIGESVKGEAFEMPGYEFLITGGSDYCGFPMRRGILGVRKKITLLGGVGFKAKRMEKGVKRRKTVCGHKVSENIVQINLKVTKEGGRKLADLFGKKEEVKEAPKEEKKAEKKPKEEKVEVKKAEEKKEEKAEAKPKEEKKAEEKKEEKPKEAKTEEKPEAKQEKTEEKKQ